MALSSDEQALFDHARAGLPQWFWDDERANEELGEAAKLIGRALLQIQHWRRQTLILEADGPTSAEPDWLAEHARDRNTRRQAGESEDTLRYRLRRAPDSVTRPNLVNAMGLILTAADVVTPASMVELPRDGIFLGGVSPDGALDGGVFAVGAGGVMTFLPTTPFAYPPFQRATAVEDPFAARSGRVRAQKITISGAAASGNNGTFITTGLVSDAVAYHNASGAAGTDATAHWSTSRVGPDGVVAEGFAHSYLDRGERLSRPQGGEMIVVLPYGTSDTTVKSVTEMLRQRKAAGIILRVERREVP